MSLNLSKDFKGLNNSTICQLWCTWLYILNKPFDVFMHRHGKYTHMYTYVYIFSDTIIKCNPIFWDTEVDDIPFYLPWLTKLG